MGWILFEDSSGPDGLSHVGCRRVAAFYVSCGYKPVGPVTYPLSDETSMGATRMVKSLATDAYQFIQAEAASSLR